MSVTHRLLSAAGTDSPTIEAGPSDAAEAVVFIHGNPGSHGDWTALVEATGEFARAVAFDMPGFGKAKAPSGFGFDVPAYAEFIDSARAELGIERVHLVLHDFGGPFGLSWGLAHADRWASVALLNIGVMPGYEWHSMAKRWRTPVVGELSQLWVPRFGWRRLMQSTSPKGLPAEFVDTMYDNYDRETRNTVLKLYRATPDPAKMAGELGGALAQLRKPALIIWGAKDQYIGVEFAERQREFFDVQDVCVLPDSGHWAFQDDPDRVRDALIPFLERQLTRAVEFMS